MHIIFIIEPVISFAVISFYRKRKDIIFLFPKAKLNNISLTTKQQLRKKQMGRA